MKEIKYTITYITELMYGNLDTIMELMEESGEVEIQDIEIINKEEN